MDILSREIPHSGAEHPSALLVFYKVQDDQEGNKAKPYCLSLFHSLVQSNLWGQ